MEPVQPKTTPAGWRYPLALGLSIGVAIPLSRAVAANLEPSLGAWGVALSLAVVAVVGGGVSAGVSWLLRPSRNDNA